MVLILNDLGEVEDGKDEDVEGCREVGEEVVDGTEEVGGVVTRVVLAAVVWGVVRLGAEVVW